MNAPNFKSLSIGVATETLGMHGSAGCVWIMCAAVMHVAATKLSNNNTVLGLSTSAARHLAVRQWGVIRAQARPDLNVDQQAAALRGEVVRQRRQYSVAVLGHPVGAT